MLAIFASGTGTTLQTLMDCQEQYNYQVSLVVVNRACLAQERAEKEGVKTLLSKDWEEIDQTLTQQHIQLIVLAGFLAIVPSRFCEKRHKKIINDIVLKIGVDRTAQIDHILINRAGIFVIETKNYKGRIYGSSDRLYWCQYLGNRKYNFYNPMKQNRAHVKRLQEVLGDQYPYYSIVVFAQNNISHIGIENVINLKDLTGYIHTHNKKVLKKTEIRKIYRKLNRIQKKKHNHIFWANDAA